MLNDDTMFFLDQLVSPIITRERRVQNPSTNMFKKADQRDHSQVPELVVSEESKTNYRRGKFLGKGGFARCYELRDRRDFVYAAKVIPKSMLIKGTHREKFVNEIAIHKSVEHPYIVKIFSCFGDSNNMYILLELCANRSLMELQKRRSYVTEPEARYFMNQIVSAVGYLHEKLIIHRDLKLGNVFIDAQMRLKVGDFGLATRLKSPTERKDTLCGTPNYIAPEMLQHRKHSFEVDVWACGCILYTLLCGHPPFETNSLQETYSRIKANNYTMPRMIGAYAASLIRDLLQSDEFKRPKIAVVAKSKFFRGYMPESLPVSCLECVPKIDEAKLEGGQVDCTMFAESIHGASPMQLKGTVKSSPSKPSPPLVTTQRDCRYTIVLLKSLQTKVKAVETEMLTPHAFCPLDIFTKYPNVESESPNYTPSFFVSKWVDYSDKYGLGYQLADGTVGVLFNDATTLLCDQNFEHVMYSERNTHEVHFIAKEQPKYLSKKMVLLSYFVKYMHDQLITATNQYPEAAKSLSRPPFLVSWFRTESAIVLHLSTGLVQVNFFKDHSKFIFDGSVDAITVIASDRSLHTYRFSTLANNGASDKLKHVFKFLLRVFPRIFQRAEKALNNAK